jgi:hypothetical protein
MLQIQRRPHGSRYVRSLYTEVRIEPFATEVCHREGGLSVSGHGGFTHLFGGEQVIASDIIVAFRRLGSSIKISLCESYAGAWAFSQASGRPADALKTLCHSIVATRNEPRPTVETEKHGRPAVFEKRAKCNEPAAFVDISIRKSKV